MTTSALRPLLAAVSLGLALLSPTLRGDAVSDARAALAAGDFAGMRSALDPHIAANPADAQARVLRALAILASAAETDLPDFLKNKMGAREATLDVFTGQYTFALPRPVAYFNVPGFTVAGSYYEYTPAINLYDTGGAQPSISFENKGSVPEVLAFRVTRGADGAPDLDTTFYLEGRIFGFVNAYPPAYPELEVFAGRPGLSVDSDTDTVTVTLRPGSAFTIGMVNSPGGARFTPLSPLPSTILVSNGRATAITQERFPAKANLSDAVPFAADLDAKALAPAIADLSVAGPAFSLTLLPGETGHPVDVILAYPDIQLLLAELKFTQAFRRLLIPYNVAHKLTPAFFDSQTLAQLISNRAFLTLRKGNFAADLAASRTLFGQAVDHYFAAGDAGLWTRPAPLSGHYLFTVDQEDPDTAEEALRLDTALAQFRAALHGPVPLADLSDKLAADPTLPPDAAVNLSPLFGPKPLNLRALAPALSPGSGLIVPGSSVNLLTSGLLTDVGTAWWENYLAERGLSDDDILALFAKPRVFSQPAASTTVEEGASAVLRIVAESYPAPTYQWYRGSGKNAVPVEGATLPVLTLAPAHRTDAGTYTVRVTNTVPGKKGPVAATVTSKPARLVVTYPPEIVTPPVALTRLAKRSARFTVAAAAVPAPSYQWFLDDAPINKATKAAYSVAASPARAGAYKVSVTNSRGSVTSTPVTLTVHELPRFTLQPVKRSVPAGGTATFTVEVAGNPAPTLQWYRGSGRTAEPIDGATGTEFTIDSVSAADAGDYSVVATNVTVNGAGTGEQTNRASSRTVKLTVTAAPSP